jgi:hypothetical protein
MYGDPFAIENVIVCQAIISLFSVFEAAINNHLHKKRAPARSVYL